MTYRVMGQLTPHNSTVDTNSRDFDTYTDATDYYTSVFSQVCADMTDIGGEFVITLMAITDDDSWDIVKRHVASTTILI